MRHVPNLLLDVLIYHQPKTMFNIGYGKKNLERVLKDRGLLPKWEGIDIEIDGGDITKTVRKGSKRYDLVVCDQVIEHVEDRDLALWNMQKHIDKDGLLFISSIIREPGAWYFYGGKLEPNHKIEWLSENHFYWFLDRRVDVLKIKTRQFFLKYYIPVPGFKIVEAICQKR